MKVRKKVKIYFARALIGSSGFFIGMDDERILALSESEAARKR